MDVEKKETFTPDYHFCCNKKTTAEERRKMNIGDIWINAAVCTNCKDYIRSVNRYDFKTCSCGSVSVDGGSWYIRRVGKLEHMISFQELFGDAEEEEQLKKAMEKAYTQ